MQFRPLVSENRTYFLIKSHRKRNIDKGNALLYVLNVESNLYVNLPTHFSRSGDVYKQKNSVTSVKSKSKPKYLYLKSYFLHRCMPTMN